MIKIQIEDQIDEYIKLTEELKILKDKQEILKESIKQYMKQNNLKNIPTNLGFAKLSETTRKVVDRVKLERAFGTDVISEFINETRFDIMRIQSHESAERSKKFWDTN